ncbi:hypothetical protein [Paraurantiacibacter namhicola]|uniref:Uncharacterized protein n=1 Tax=Paraurantiacibacter namhicola TaxID=645517 RepID=A0A1C7D7H0_9SPHN|nr:hypothetical protein [Paraurantiacibacter namhicola]ANU07424.1 hypothetical protein A6F65_01116 [Paraurantiacibacter namhicola]
MAEQLTRPQIAEKARIHELLPQVLPQVERAPHVTDRTFEMPRAMYAATVGLYLAIIAVLGLGFANPEMAIPVAIFAIFIFAGFGVPALWTRIAPQTGSKALTMGQFRLHGINTLTGRLTATQAGIQMLILPVLILFWAIVTVTIAALV